ncbi:hypothetical protein [Prescottella equi]|uniref:hypothetical protein n=1 Tax=Rhodococcus hoagii TaxID=43767 RepID=UPI001A021153|nr:hypothetical protein [Prescottella equi]MBM4599209.1 hypothetical protein [Prescottella equi]NKS34147.1 hypothetical protein [Prescottella equi]BCN64244.1 hypothetical protein RE9431_26990 [Prescottella equi]BCN74092.1 hypothetical protein RE0327_26910 [Prescottella equi]BCN84077.1 hypothetical protein RE0356_27180 [Prescottella equi]
MNYLDNVVQKVGQVVGEAVGHVSKSDATQSVTIARPRDEVTQFWRDPQSLSAVFDQAAEVRAGDVAGEYVWSPVGSPDDAESWRATLREDEDGFRFTTTGGDATGPTPGFVLGFRDAPHGLGTEVTLRARTPLPEFLSSLAAFAVLYRARALLQTGEVPTLRDNPSARRSEQ